MKEAICEQMDELYARILLPKETLYSGRSDYQQIDVIKTKSGKALILDGSLQLYTRDEFIYHEMLVHFPMIHHPKPERVLVLGGGDGFLLREILKYRAVKEVVLVDLDKKVVDVCKRYFAEENGRSFDDGRVKLVIADALEYAERDERFDVIIMDLIEPYGIGAKLYTEQSMAKFSRQLKEDGVMATHCEIANNENMIGLKMYSFLSGMFPSSKIGLSYINSFDGLWTFAVMSNKELKPVNPETAGLETRYFEPEALGFYGWLPPYLREKLDRFKREGFEKFDEAPVIMRKISLSDKLEDCLDL